MFLREAEDRTLSEAIEKHGANSWKTPEKKIIIISFSPSVSRNHYWSAFLFSHSENDLFLLNNISDGKWHH